MAKIRQVENSGPEVKYVMYCPGCKCHHYINDTWQFNGDFDNPTISPSILVRWGDRENPNRVCHSFIRNGKWEFLPDSYHELAGKTVDMIDEKFSNKD